MPACFRFSCEVLRRCGAVLQAAGLVDAVADKTAVLTVLAPTDAAFEKVPAETLEALLADTEALTSVRAKRVPPPPSPPSACTSCQTTNLEP